MQRIEYMPLMDRIIDEAEELAANRILLPDATDMTILSAVTDIIGHDLHPNSTGAHLALAAYRRMENARDKVNEIWTV